MILTLNEATGKAPNALGNAAGRLLVEQTAKFLDLGLVIDGDTGGNGYQLAAGAEVSLATIPLISDCEWVRYIQVFWKNGNIVGEFRPHRFADEAMTIDSLSATSLAELSEFGASTGWTTTFFGPAVSTPCATVGLLGRFAKLSYKNYGASAANVYMRIVLFG
ncbi:MAG: hypothetical protein NT018_11740 [Armatimonadetes bacterium]|nr:hypothetical protein [Armatimonadota bacterium]